MKQLATGKTVALTAGLVAAVAGCQEGREATHPVRGLVRFSDGTPVRFGTVEFRSEKNGRIARGVLDQRGRFTLGTFDAADGAVAGAHQVIVVQLAPPELLDRRPRGELADPETHAEHEHDGLIDPEFSQYSTTPLTANVSQDESNQVDLVVEPLRTGRQGRD